MPVSVAAASAEALIVSGGELLRTRAAEGVVDAWVAVTLPAGGAVEVVVQE